ncbi:MAG: TolC family protein [Bacteroidales bacterium]|nr:TolC family protein [Bacteroidales bacterium]MBD5224069.1 TolC family protein [Bacteroidales bacterium]MBD5301899.1 TolC family protein [Bacteroides sp.]
MKTTKYFILAAFALSVSSCHIYKSYELPVENSFVSKYDESAKAEKDSTSLPFLSWNEIFTDPLLQEYINTALEKNKDLDDAVKNIDIARAQLKGAKLSYLPAVALNPNGGASKYGSGKMDTWTYTIPMSISWEVDIFGKILNRKRGAQVAVDQMEDYYQATRSQIICGVANCYYGLILLNQQLALTERTSEIWKDQVESMKLMKLAGMVNEAAVVQSEANYWNIMGTIPDIKNSINQMNNTLALLLHTYPQEFKVSGDMNFDLPEKLTSGVPVSYLAVRPDVKAAERGLASAYYTTNSARAAFYPGLTISSNGGFTNLLGSMVSNPGKWFIQLAGSLAAPIFSRGQNIATLEVAKARQKQAMNAFEKSVLSASADVSNALAAYKYNKEKREFIIKQIDDLEKSVEYTQELLTLNTSTTYLEVLTARSSLLSAQLSSLNAWHSKVSALITLYQAVGGGR